MHDRYAVVGLAGRYPGAADLNAYWHTVREGRDASSAGPVDRPGGTVLLPGRRGHLLPAVAEFDADFFGMDPAEAALTDPQARLFQETVWEALEDAGCTGSRLDALTGPDGRSRAVGVFVGVESADYALLAAEGWARGLRRMPASGHGDLAAGLAARLRLSGPAQAVDSGGASALTAVHLAVAALRRGECAAAVAGGVELLLHPSRAREGAGEGIGAVVLKPLAAALADGDQVHAVLRRTGSGRPARSTGPAPDATRGAHPTGPPPTGPRPATGAGTVPEADDAAAGEVPATAPVLRETYETTTRRVGDAGAATGMAALTAAVLQLRSGTIAPTTAPGVSVPWNGPRDTHGQALPRTAVVELTARQGRCETVELEEYLPPDGVRDIAPRAVDAPSGVPTELVLLSAPTPDHLTALAARLARWLAPAAAENATGDTAPHHPTSAFHEAGDLDPPDVPTSDTSDTPSDGTETGNTPTRRTSTVQDAAAAPPSLDALARTLRTGRAALPCRLALTVSDLAGLHGDLTAFAAAPHAVPDRRFRQADLRSGPSDPHGLAEAPETEAYLGALWRGGRLDQLAGLWLSGVSIDWAAIERRSGAGAMVVPLPASVFLRRPLWLDDEPFTDAPERASGPAGPTGECT
ncbi:polyketide synthase [Streptomyces sp. NPDC048566]|uniref:beta-ketoacyl [acyl carrier protein] synthase domain-containing protein n=1 Tax=Streptomyces sp. NPDC048566 TaxID=3365569 RepID=UPI00371E4979